MSAKLNFREKGLPKAVRKKLYLLSVVFIAALILFQIALNRNISEKNISMAKASLPLVEISAYGNVMGELHGYINDMDACYMRDALIPLTEDRQMDISIQSYDYDAKEVSYEIRSLDTSRKIADTKITQWDISDNTMKTSVQIENLVEAGEEYLFVLTIKNDSQSLHYYTRIMLPKESTNTKKCLDFARDFHETAMSSHYEDLASYVETSPYCDQDTLAQVSINSTLDQIGWKGFSGEMTAKPLIQITDINDDYLSLSYLYQMQEKTDSHTTFYNVEEYFKVRYTEEQIYLLDYQRNMEQLLDADNVSMKNNKLSVGITDNETNYLSNETGTIVSFVQGGELFSYDQNKQSFTKVFGFIEDMTDKRENYQQHNISILNIDETGNMDFVVYGYMNRGSHEGDCGINLYHYNSTKQEIIEQIFISSTHSYQILNANFSNLLYENTQGDFYIMLGGTLAKVGLDNLSTQELISGLHTGQYAVSQSGQYVAWISDGEMDDSISVMNLETEEIRTIKAENGTKIKPLSFMTNDLVYGVANTNDITTDVAGSSVYPMSQLLIVDATTENFDLLKRYEKSGYYVTAVSKDSFTLTLERVQKKNGTYVTAESDTIKDSAGEQNKTVTIAKVSSKTKGSITQYVMTEPETKLSASSPKHQTTGMAVTKHTRNMEVTTSDNQQTYFVYVGSHVVLTTQNLTKAIAKADEQLGLVIDNKQRYIWKRGKKTYVNAFSDVEVGKSDASANTSAGCISAMLVRKGTNSEVHALLAQGTSPVTVLQRALKDNLVLDLSGCTLSQVLYYVSHGAPVYARTGNNTALLIIGYDAANIIVYHSDTDTYSKLSSDEASALFEDAGNVFISYIE